MAAEAAKDRDEFSLGKAAAAERLAAAAAEAKSHQQAAQQAAKDAAAAQDAKFEAINRLADVETTAWVALQGRAELKEQLDDLRADMAASILQDKHAALTNGLYLEAMMEELLSEESAHHAAMQALQDKVADAQDEAGSARNAAASMRASYKARLSELEVKLASVLSAARTDKHAAAKTQHDLQDQLAEARAAAKAAQEQAAALQAKAAFEAQQAAEARLRQHSTVSVAYAGQGGTPSKKKFPPAPAQAPAAPSPVAPPTPNKPVVPPNLAKPRSLKISRIPSVFDCPSSPTSAPTTPGAVARPAAHPIAIASRISDASVVSAA